MKKLFIVTALITLCTITMEAQIKKPWSEPYQPNVIHPSPQAQIFEKYMNHEISEYNGLPSIEIPLYEIETNGLKIPITLSYHASGVKFMAFDGDIGAGWSINTEGYRISRTINSQPDEKFRKYPEDTLALIHNRRCYANASYPCSYFYEDMNGLLMPGDMKDKEYDIFKYMLPTTLGTFIISDRNKREATILESNLDKVIIDPNGESLKLDEILLYDNKGFRYYMGGQEDLYEMHIYPTGSPISKSRVGWPLRKIQSPHNVDIVNFEYEKFGDDRYGLKHFLTYHAFVDAPNSYNGGWDNDPYRVGCTQPIDYEIYTEGGEGYTDMVSLYMSKINTESHKIEFVRKKVFSTDHGEDYRLNEILIKNWRGEIIKSIVFNYTKNFDYVHTLLESVTIKSAQGEIIQRYKFDYYMPPKGTLFIADQWGYYKIAKTDVQNLPPKGIESPFFHNEFKDEQFYVGCNINQFDFATPILHKLVDHVLLKDWPFYDRTLNNEPHFFSLKQITFPTGGTTTYEYEPNQYPGIKAGGGQRISKIISRPDNNAIPITTVFKYGRKEDGLGINNFPVDYTFFREENQIYYILKLPASKSSWIGLDIEKSLDGRYEELDGEDEDPLGGEDKDGKDKEDKTPYMRYLYSHIQRVFSVESHSPIYSLFSVKYPEVTTYQFKENEYIGKIQSIYDIQQEYLFDEMRMPWYASKDFFEHTYWSEKNILNVKEYRPGYKPLLEYRIYHNSNGKTLKIEEFYYQKHTNSYKKYLNLKSIKKIFHSLHSELRLSERLSEYGHVLIDPTYNLFERGLVDLDYATILSEIAIGSDQLHSKSTYEYSSDNSSEEIETYEWNYYDEKGRLTKNYKGNSSGDYSKNFIEEYIYPELGSALDRQNMTSTVVETITTHNDKEIGRIKYNYPTDAILPSNRQTSASGINNLCAVLTYNQYDYKGNLLQYTGIDGIPVSYIWSYNNAYPIAEVKNATYADLVGVLGQNLIDRITSTSVPSNTDISTINSLRNNTAMVKDAFVTTYTYKPLVGMATVTDPAGVTTYYDYDDFGRLKETYIYKDGVVAPANKQSVKKYDYHYQNQ
jgi:YD repeat-containing protein